MWKDCTLGDVITLKRGYDLPAQARTEGSYPIVSSAGISGTHAEWKVHGPGVVTGRYGTLGEIHYIPGDFWPLNTTLYVQDFKGNHPRFVSYLLRTLDFGSRSGAAAVPGVNRNDLHRLPVKCPDTTEQRRIVSILSAYDDLIENNTRRIAILEEMARRIYEEWFVRFRFPGHEKVRMVESELGLVPEGWKTTTLGAVCKRLKSGGTPSRSNNDYWADGTVDWYKTKELWDGFLFESEEKISEKAIEDRKTSVYEAGTILMAIYGSPTVGRMGITTRRSTCNQAALGFEPDEQQITKWFLFHTLYGLRQEFNSKAQGAAQQNISKEKVAETVFIKPPIPIISAFEQMAEPLWQMMRNLQTKNRNLRTTRDLLLPRLISGELDVSHLPEPEAMAA